MYYGRITQLQTDHQVCICRWQYTGVVWSEASDKSVDLPVKWIQFRDETSDRDGLSIINTDFDYSRASIALTAELNKLLHFGSMKPVKRFLTFFPLVLWLAGDVVAQRRNSSEAFFHKLLIIYSLLISQKGGRGGEWKDGREGCPRFLKF